MLSAATLRWAEPGAAATLVRTAAGSAGARVGGIALTFLVGVQLARGLGPENYGLYSLALAIIALLTVPIEFGVPQLLTREVAAAHARQDWPRLYGVLSWADRVVLAASAIIAVLAAIALATFSRRIPDAWSAALIWGFVLVPLVALGHLRGASLRGLQHIVLGQVPEVLVRPLLLAITVFVAFRLQPAMGAATAVALNALAAAVSFVVSAYWLRSRLPQPALAVTPVVQARRWLAGALPMALTEGMRVLQGHLATLLLGVFAAVAAVGLFRVASATAIAVAMPITLMNVIVAPMVARLFALHDLPRLRRLAAMAALAMFLGVLALSLPFVVGGDWLLAAVFGDGYRPARTALLVLCAGQLASAAFGAAATCLNMCGHERRVTRAFGLSLAANLIAALALIPSFDAVGAACANALALLLWNVLMWRDARRLLQVDTSIFAGAPARQGRVER